MPYVNIKITREGNVTPEQETTKSTILTPLSFR